MTRHLRTLRGPMLTSEHFASQVAATDNFNVIFVRVAGIPQAHVLSRLTTALSCLPACRSANAGSRPGMRAALASLLDAHGASQPVSGETPPQASPVLVSGLMTGDRHTPRVQSRPVRVLSPPRPSARSRTAPAVPATVPQCGRPILLQRGCAHRVADVPYTVSVRMLYPGRACGKGKAGMARARPARRLVSSRLLSSTRARLAKRLSRRAKPR